LKGSLVFLALIGLLTSQLAVWVWQEHYVAEQLHAVQSDIPELDQFLEQKTMLSQDIGALTVLGLSGRTIKKQALNELPDDDKEVLERLAVIQQLYQVDGVYVLNAQGKIVAHKTEGKSSLGSKVAWRPYFKQAMQGIANVYPAVGSVSGERGLYFAVPIHATTQVNSEIIGVLMLKKSIADIQQRLDRYKDGKVLLLSPQGVVFATNEPDWQYRLMPPITPEKMAAITQQKQFGKMFESDVISVQTLPFEWQKNTYGSLTLLAQRYVVSDTEVDWSDPLGNWRLLLMRPAQLVLTPAQQVLVYVGVPLLIIFIGLLGLWLRQQQHDKKMLNQKIRDAESKTVELINVVDNGIMNIDSDGAIVYANPSALKILNVKRNQVVGHAFVDVMQLSSLLDVQGVLFDALRYGEKYQTTIPYVTEDHLSLMLALSLIPLTTMDGWNGFVCVFHDTSEIARAQMQIQAQLDTLLQLNSVSVDRELMMIELKRQINALLILSGKESRYVIAD